nr:helix-turn-helix transcriptional regulator [Streptomyces davaonensis]
MARLALRAGLGRTTSSKALNGDSTPSETTLVSLAKALRTAPRPEHRRRRRDSPTTTLRSARPACCARCTTNRGSDPLPRPMADPHGRPAPVLVQRGPGTSRADGAVRGGVPGGLGADHGSAGQDREGGAGSPSLVGAGQHRRDPASGLPRLQVTRSQREQPVDTRTLLDHVFVVTSSAISVESLA